MSTRTLKLVIGLAILMIAGLVVMWQLGVFGSEASLSDPGGAQPVSGEDPGLTPDGDSAKFKKPGAR